MFAVKYVGELILDSSPVLTAKRASMSPSRTLTTGTKFSNDNGTEIELAGTGAPREIVWS